MSLPTSIPKKMRAMFVMCALLALGAVTGLGPITPAYAHAVARPPRARRDAESGAFVPLSAAGGTHAALNIPIVHAHTHCARAHPHTQAPYRAHSAHPAHPHKHTNARACTRTHTHVGLNTQTNSHTHKRTHTRTHTRAHTHTHTHTHTHLHWHPHDTYTHAPAHTAHARERTHVVYTPAPTVH